MERLTKKERKEQRRLEWQEKLKKEQKNKRLKKIGVWTGTAVVVILAVIGLIRLANSPSSSPQPTATLPPVNKSDIAIGNPGAKAVLIEYADFQCPACAAYHPIVNQILSDFKGRIYYIYRFFPLIQLHQNAMAAAQAAYAASLQGKFFDMYNMLFDTQTSWENLPNARDTFISYAKKLNLNLDKFKKDMDAQTTKVFINNEYNQGINIGVNSTPTFFVNGKLIQNPRTYNEFKKLIQDALGQK